MRSRYVGPAPQAGGLQPKYGFYRNAQGQANPNVLLCQTPDCDHPASRHARDHADRRTWCKWPGCGCRQYARPGESRYLP